VIVDFVISYSFYVATNIVLKLYAKQVSHN